MSTRLQAFFGDGGRLRFMKDGAVWGVENENNMERSIAAVVDTAEKKVDI